MSTFFNFRKTSKMKREGIRATKAENFPGQKIQYLFIHKCCMGMVWSLWKTEDSGESKGSKRKEKIPRQAVYAPNRFAVNF